MNSYKNWILDNQNAVNTLLDTELEYWLSQNSYVEPVETDANSVNYRETLEIENEHSISNKDLQNKMITALLFSLYKIKGVKTHVIEREGHGRNPLSNHDVSDTIGWFTCKYITKYDIINDSLDDTFDHVAAVNDEVPNGGVGYEILKYYGPAYINRQLECESPILFNYLGDLTYKPKQQRTESNEVNNNLILSSHTVFSSTMEKSMEYKNSRSNKLIFNAWIENNKISCNLDIDKELGFDEKTCKEFTNLYENELRLLINPDSSSIKYGGVTPFQKGLISYAITYPESKNYITQNSFKINGDIEFDFFYKICEILTSKYDILRTTYGFNDNTGEFVSAILPKGTLDCNLIELKENIENEDLRKLLYDIRLRGFLMDKEPSIRFNLIKTANKESIVVITCHHIIIDANSLKFIISEIIQISSDLSSGIQPVLSIPKELQFSSYTSWINSKDEKAAIDYWKTLLKDFEPTLLEAKTIGEREISEDPYSEVEFYLDTNKDIEEILKKRNITKSAAFNYLIGFVFSKYNSTKSFIWGNTVAVRPFELQEIENIIGPCITTIPVAMSFESQKNIFDSIKELQMQIIESVDYSYLTINDIIRNAGKKMLFSMSFDFHRFTKSNNPNENSRITNLGFDNHITSHFSIGMLLQELEKGVNIRARYRNDRFSSFLINNICKSVINLYNNLDKIMETPVKEIDIVKIGEVSISNIVGNEYDTQGMTLHGAFSKMAVVFPKKTSVMDSEGKKMTYQELDQSSDNIAKFLIKNNLTGAVGVKMERSVDIISAVIGILKSGSHVVSIESNFPEEKVEWINRNANLSAVLLDESAQIKIDSKIIRINEIKNEAQESVNLPDVSSKSLCSINYTSGSTGVPKLVKIDHAGHINRILWLKNNFPATDKDMYGFKTMLCFGPSLREIFEPLAQGSTLFVYSKESNNNPEIFNEISVKNQVSRLFLTPTFIQLLFDCNMEQALSTLTYLEISGEPISTELFGNLKNTLPNLTIACRYGATEAPGTVYYTKGETKEKRLLPLGKPIQNTIVKVLDSQNKELPKGIIGEIAIGGESVSTGYINQELEKDSFVEINQTKYVKTGDLGIIDSEDKLIFQGRKNRMVKIRGYRVELGEIEFNLALYPEISKAVVSTVNSGSSTRLVAFYVSGEEIEGSRLKAFLEKKIPNYMLPNEYIRIDEIPLTESGKINYTKLLESVDVEHSINIVAPSNKTEEKILEVLQKLLNKKIDTVSNFFEIGMDSILALRALYEIKRIFDVEILASDIYKNPCIKDMAAFILAKQKNPSAVNGPGYYYINYNENNNFLFFIPPIGNTSLNFKVWEKILPQNLTLVVFDPIDAEDSIQLSMEQLAEKYTKVIRTFDFVKTINLIGWSLGATVAYQIACSLEGKTELGEVVLLDPGFSSENYDNQLTEEKLRSLFNKMGGSEESESIKNDLLEKMLKANKIVVDYKPKQYKGRIRLIKPTEISADERNFNKPMNDLDLYCLGEITVNKIEGDHMNMIFNLDHLENTLGKIFKEHLTV